MPDWKKTGKKAGKAYLTGGLSLVGDARKKRDGEVPEEGASESTLDMEGAATTPVPSGDAAAARLVEDEELDVPSGRPDVEAAKRRMLTKFGGRREIRKLDEYLWEDETVERMATGRYAGNNGLVVLTDRRLVFLFHGVARTHNEDFPLDSVTSIAASFGLALGKLTVFAAGAKSEIHNLTKTDAKAIVDAIRHRISTRSTSSANDSAVQAAAVDNQRGPDVLAQIKQLGELRDSGVLTAEEFEAKKLELLGRL